MFPFSPRPAAMLPLSLFRLELWPTGLRILLGLLCLVVWQRPGQSQTSLQESLKKYRDTEDQNPVTALISQVEAGEVVLDYEPGFGYLRSVLRELDIPVSSQSLVFSKTSLQMGRISPQNPRAIYFNDEVYIGWVQGSSLLEISASDPQLGAAFYTFRMNPRQINIRRENNGCLACHRLPMTQGVPGHAVRSVLTRPNGSINSLSRSFVTDHASPIAERWGGWYVTGDLGDMHHMGNSFLEGEDLIPKGSLHRDDLRDDIDTSRWLSPHSDAVALMVMEHQTQMQNVFTRANLDVQQAMERLEIPAVSDPATNDVENQGANDGKLASTAEAEGTARTESTADAERELAEVIDRSAKSVVDYMLFTNEAPLTSAIRGSTTFAEEFARRGPACEDGSSLREFDLETRLFRYPCSYLIYSPSFSALEGPLRQRIYERLFDVLTNRDVSEEYAHLSQDVRVQILRILRETKADLPDQWND
jgi:hypothetical protein